MMDFVFRPLRGFFRNTIWRENPRDPAPVRAFLRLMQLAYIVVRHFQDDRGFLRSSALAYTTLLSLVPLLAFVFSILKGLGAEKQFRAYLINEAARQEAQAEPGASAPADGGSAASQPAPPATGWQFLNRLTGGRPEVAERLMGYIERTDFTALGVFGLALLLWTVVDVLSTVEATFNDVWGVTKGRPWLRRFGDYTAVLVIAPVLLLTAVGVAGYLVSTPLAEGGVTATLWRTVARAIVWLGPAALVWISFTVFYAFMPYAHVGFVPALVGGVIGGTLWQLAFWGYTTFNVGIARYNAIYTSFAALPIFLAWLYLSWVIVIIGAEVAFAAGHLESYRRSRKDVHLSADALEIVALRIFLEIARAFRTTGAPTDEDLARRSKVPVKTVIEVLNILKAADLVVEVPSAEKLCFKPSHALAGIAPNDVLGAVRRHGDRVVPDEDDALWVQAARLHASLEQALRSGDMARSFEEILQSFDAGASAATAPKT